MYCPNGHSFGAIGAWEGTFNEEPLSQAISVIIECIVKFCINHKMLNGILFLMCLRISVTTKSFYLHYLIIDTNGGECPVENIDTDSFPAS